MIFLSKNLFPFSSNVSFFIWLIIQNNAEGKHGSCAISRLDSNIAIKALNNLLRDNQSEADSICVHRTSIGDLAKQLEQFESVLSLDTDTAVYYRDNDLVALGVGREDAFDPVFVSGGPCVLVHFRVITLFFLGAGREFFIVALALDLLILLLLAAGLSLDVLDDDLDQAVLFCELDGV